MVLKIHKTHEIQNRYATPILVFVSYAGVCQMGWMRKIVEWIGGWDSNLENLLTGQSLRPVGETFMLHQLPEYCQHHKMSSVFYWSNPRNAAFIGSRPLYMIAMHRNSVGGRMILSYSRTMVSHRWTCMGWDGKAFSKRKKPWKSL